MNPFLKIILFLFSWFILVIIGQYFFQYVYLIIPEESINFGWWGSSQDWATLFGAIFSFYFFLPLLVVIFYNKFKFYILPFNIILLIPVLRLFKSDLYFVGTLVALSVIGWLIGEGILKLKNKMKK